MDALGGGFLAARFFDFLTALLPIGQDSIQTDFLDLSMAGYNCIPQVVLLVPRCFANVLARSSLIIASNLQMSS
jgi:hypothetical protein